MAAAPGKIAAAKKLVTALTLPMPALDPVAANPALQKFWTTLESFALTTATEVAAGAAVAAGGAWSSPRRLHCVADGYATHAAYWAAIVHVPPRLPPRVIWSPAGGAGTLADFELATKQAESRWNPEDDTSKPDAEGMMDLAGVRRTGGGRRVDASPRPPSSS